jgi:hypothetical protein
VYHRHIPCQQKIYVDAQDKRGSSTPVMARESYASLRLPPDLKAEIQEIASSQHRSLSNTIELLLRRGIQDFRSDGILVELPGSSKAVRSEVSDPQSTALAKEIAKLVIQSLEKRERGGGNRPPKKSKSRGRAAA